MQRLYDVLRYFPMTPFKAKQLVCINDMSSLAFGRIARVLTASETTDITVQFVDLPKAAVAEHDSVAWITEFPVKALTPLAPVSTGAFYLLVRIVERDGERRYTHRVLACGKDGQSQASLVNGIARSWYESGGEWDEAEEVWRFDTHHFVLAEDWRELSLSEYVSLLRDLSDCTPECHPQ